MTPTGTTELARRLELARPSLARVLAGHLPVLSPASVAAFALATLPRSGRASSEVARRMGQ